MITWFTFLHGLHVVDFYFLVAWFKFLLIFNFMIFIDFNLYFYFILFLFLFLSLFLFLAWGNNYQLFGKRITKNFDKGKSTAVDGVQILRVITHERDSKFVKKKIHMGRWNSPNSWLPCRYLSRIFMQFWTRKKNNSTKEVNRLIGDLWIFFGWRIFFKKRRHD